MRRVSNSVLLAWGALAAFVVGSRALTGSFIVDDAYITFRYATQLIDFQEFSFNAGERVLGTTSPLFTFLLAGAYGMGVTPDVSALWIAGAADIVTVAMIAGVVGVNDRPEWAFLTAILIVVSPAYLTYSVSGMETSLYVSLLLIALRCYQVGWAVWGGLAAGLCFLCRPDGALLAALLAIAFSLRNMREASRFVLATTLIAAPWVIFSAFYFGSPIPQSIIAKAADTLPWTVSWTNFANFFSHGHYLVLTALAVPGAAVAWRSGNTAVRVWLVWALCYSAVFLITNAFTYFPWYFIPLLPPYFLCVAASLSYVMRAVGGLEGVASGTWGRAILGSAGAVILILGGWRLATHARFLESLYLSREAIYRSTALELAGIDPSCVVAATEIGTIGYYYPGQILDLVGLVSPEVVGKGTDDVLERSRTRWVVTYDTHLDSDVLESRSFSKTFALVRSTRVAEDRSLQVYERLVTVPCEATRTSSMPVRFPMSSHPGSGAGARTKPLLSRRQNAPWEIPS
jgi:hypothetical protein